MQLVSFSVTNYRSITAAYKLPVRQSTVLIGPNNEGKSNILRALVTALEALQALGGRRIQAGRLRTFVEIRGIYNWQQDFPVTLQEKKPDGESVFFVEFRLTEEEVQDFHSEVGSNLNGTLPIELTLGQKAPGFRVVKKGPGATALSRKAERIADFVAKRISINYIPAVRTAGAAEEVVSRMVERELAAIESDADYQSALAKVADLQQPLLERLSASICDTLREFLPNVKRVAVEIPREARFRALRRACEIVVDDGTPTSLASKGDGVQSLAALSLLRHRLGTSSQNRDLILAIEEPESHLHPNAIHQLKTVIADIAKTNQVIMTTHCPLFVDRVAIKSNIIVHKNKATPARDIKSIRSILGVRASDNLQHAELMLLVEGEDDRISLKTLLSHHSKALHSAISQGSLGIDSLMGGTNLSYKLGQVRDAICASHAFLDNDKCGVDAYAVAERDGLVTPADVQFAIVVGLRESEIEDLYDVDLYAKMLMNKYGVSVQSPRFSGIAKWSDRVKETFRHQGKIWSGQIEAQLKADVAALVVATPAMALNTHRCSSFEALVTALELKLRVLDENKK